VGLEALLDDLVGARRHDSAAAAPDREIRCFDGSPRSRSYHRSVAAEIRSFVTNLLRKKFRTALSRGPKGSA
jgi:hypothetical protein